MLSVRHGLLLQDDNSTVVAGVDVKKQPGTEYGSDRRGTDTQVWEHPHVDLSLEIELSAASTCDLIGS